MSTSAPITNERFLDADGLPLGDCGRAGVVDVAIARRGQLRARRRHDLERRTVVERERPVRTGLREPDVHELPQLVGVLGGEVVQLRAIDVGVVELPLVVVEVPPTADRRMRRDGLPALVPDAA